MKQQEAYCESGECSVFVSAISRDWLAAPLFNQTLSTLQEGANKGDELMRSKLQQTIAEQPNKRSLIKEEPTRVVSGAWRKQRTCSSLGENTFKVAA